METALLVQPSGDVSMMEAMSRWQKARTWLHLFAVGVRRRMVIGARLVLVSEGRFLLIRHTYMPGWHFAGGGVEPGETAGDAARREGEEETGYAAEGALRLHGLFLNANAATNRDHVAVFVATGFRQVRAFRSNAEIAEIGWFAADELPEAIEPGTARRIAEIVAGTTPAERW
jgi:8-oxo-dGTP pyrophosphatase MutT (NUDIX family)